MSDVSFAMIQKESMPSGAPINAAGINLRYL